MYTTKKSLIRKIQDGDNCSWDEFDRQYRPFIFTVCRKTGLPDIVCNDVTQDVLVAVFKSGKLGWDPNQGRFRDYLCGIVRHCIADHYRKAGRQPDAQDSDAVPEDVAEDELESVFHREYCEHLKSVAMEELRQRVKPLTYESYELTALRGISASEAAKILDISTEAIYVHRSRCAKILREIGREMRKNDPDLEF